MLRTSTRVIKNTGYLYLRIMVSMILSLWTTRIILNTLGISDFGLYNIIGGAIGMLGFLDASMARATQRYLNYSQGEGEIEKCKEIFNISIILHFIIAILLIFLLSAAGWLFFNGILNIPMGREKAAVIIYCCFIVSTVFTVMTVPYDATLNAHENMAYYAMIGIISSILKLVAAYAILWFCGDKLVLYGIMMVAISVLTMIVMRIYCKKKYVECIFRPAIYWNKDKAKEMTIFAGWNFLGSFSCIVGNYGNGLVMNHFYGVALNAATGVANQVLGQMQVFSSHLQKAIYPAITKSEGAGNRMLMLELSVTGCKFSFATLAIFAIPFIIEMGYIQQLWLVDVPQWAVLFSQLIIIRSLIEHMTQPLVQTIMAVGHIVGLNRVVFIFNLLPVMITFTFFSFGYPPFTMYIVNIIVFGVFISLVNIFFCHKICGLNYKRFCTEVVIPLTLSFCIAFMLVSIPMFMGCTGIGCCILSFIIGFTAYPFLFWKTCINSQEKEIVRSIVKKAYHHYRPNL